VFGHFKLIPVNSKPSVGIGASLNWRIGMEKNIYRQNERHSKRRRDGGLDIAHVIHRRKKQLNKRMVKYISINTLPSSVNAERRMFCLFICFFSF